jgi:cell division protein FtsQ
MQPLRTTAADARAHHGAKPPRRDPAPSKLRYRVHRFWLTPLYRSMLRVGIPTFLIITATGWYFANPTNRYAIAEKVAEIRRSVETRPEFMVKLMAIEGASPVVDSAIRDLLPVDFPVSSFDLDLAAMQAEVAALDVVRSVDIHIRPGGVMQINVTERVPALVWRAPDRLELIDAAGHRVATVTERSARPDLPLVAGSGANGDAPEALALIRAAGPLGERLRGLVRVGERRWDVILDGGQVIQLPQTNPVAALDQVLALDQAQDLLARDISHIDMRNPQRPTLRLAEPAVEELRRIRSLSLE